MGIGYGGFFDSLIAILKGPVYYHLWYLYALVGIYLFIPFMSKIFINSSNLERRLYLVIWMVIACVIPLLSYFYPAMGDLSSVYGLSSFVGLAGYVFLGAFAFDQVGSQGRSISVMKESVIFIFCSVLTAVFTYALSVREGAPNQLFYSYLSPVVVFASLSAFKLLIVMGSRMGKYSHSLSVLSGCTLGIYCIHVFVMNRFSLIYGSFIEQQSMLWVIPVLSISIFLLSLVPVYAARIFQPFRKII
jgi:surface polysaccharide O-acyltransferase-like enzyme